MNNIKRNILIYLDNYPMVVSLPPEQRGWLLTILMVYGDRLSRDSATELEDVLDGFPQLTPEAKVVCGFMAGNILRDTQKWLSRQRGRQTYSRPSGPQAGKRTAPVSAEAQDERAREEMDRMKRLMDQMREG